MSVIEGLVIAFLIGMGCGALGLFYLRKLIKKGKVEV